MRFFLILIWLVFLVRANNTLNAQPVTYTTTSSFLRPFWSTRDGWTPTATFSKPIEYNYLVFEGLSTITHTSNNNNSNDPLIFYRRLTFSGTQPFIITGFPIRLLDDFDGTSQGQILQESIAQQTLSAPVFFDDNNRVGLIETRTIGGLTFSNTLQLGTNLTALRMWGGFTQGRINVNGNITGSSPITIGLNSIDERRDSTLVFFTGNNSAFTGSINIQAGRLSLGSNNAAGLSVSNFIDIGAAGVLQLAPASGNIALNGKPIILRGVIEQINNISGNNSIGSEITLANSSKISANANTTLTVNNVRLQSAGLSFGLAPKATRSPTTPSSILLNGSIGVIGNIPLTVLESLSNGTVFINSIVDIANGGMVRANDTNIPGTTTDVANYAGTDSVLNCAIQIGASERISANAALSLRGGVFRTGTGFNQTFNGGLILDASVQTTNIPLRESWIELGGTTQHTLIFGDSRAGWNSRATLRIRRWQGVAGSTGTKGNIYIRKPDLVTEGLTPDQLRRIYFEGFDYPCASAMLIPVPSTVPGYELLSELVPSPSHAITSVTGSSRTTGGPYNLPNQGNIGGAIRITGCRFVDVTSVTIGGSSPLPFSVNGTFDAIIISKLPPNVSGAVTVTVNTIDGPPRSSTFTTPFVNLGYLTEFTGTQPLQTDSIWLNNPSGGLIYTPSASVICCDNNPITINVVNGNPNTRNVRIDASTILPNLNTAGPPYTNVLTINTRASIMLSAPDRIPDNTPLVLNGGSFRNFNSVNNSPASATGNNETLGTLRLNASSNIALGSGVSTVQFSASNLITWTPNTELVIHNWTGDPGNSPNPSPAKIFVGNSATGLTAAQLSQIKFIDKNNPPNFLCQAATLLSTGELIPGLMPNANTLTNNITGNSTTYIGAEVYVNGCYLNDVTSIKVGSITLVPGSHITNPSIEFSIISPGQIAFEFLKEMNGGMVTLFNGATAIDAIPGLTNRGYLSKASGDWNSSAVWLGTGNVPTAGRNVTILNGHNVLINADVPTGSMPDSLFINTGGILTLADEIEFNINRQIANSGQFFYGSKSVIKLVAGASFLNSGPFTELGLPNIFPATVSFLGAGTIGGTQPITFSKLILNAGILNLPLLPLTTIPTIKDSLIMNGGIFQFNNTNAVGPKFLTNSTLVYRAGVSVTRGVEWHSASTSSVAPTIGVTEGYPWDIRIENGTNLTLQNNSILTSPRPSVAPPNYPNLVLANNLTIAQGSINHNLRLEPPSFFIGELEIRGNVIQGSDINPAIVANLTLDASNSLTRLSLYGNFTRSYLINSGFYNNRISFIGSNPSSILTLEGTSGFNNLEINKTAGDLTLNSAVNVNSVLFLTKGIIHTDLLNARVLQLGSTASIGGGSNLSFVNGALRKVTNVSDVSDFEFKIGKVLPTPVYKPVWIANFQPSGNHHFYCGVLPDFHYCPSPTISK
jgi:hypothetical protein